MILKHNVQSILRGQWADLKPINISWIRCEDSKGRLLTEKQFTIVKQRVLRGKAIQGHERRDFLPYGFLFSIAGEHLNDIPSVIANKLKRVIMSIDK